MGLASGTNSLQTAVVNTTLGKSKLSLLLCSVGVLACEVGYAITSKFDPSVPSPRSYIDRIVMDHRQQHASAGTNNDDDNDSEPKKIAIITGANSGIGYETAKAVGRAGFHTILACRNPELAKEAVEKLERQTGLEGRFEYVHLDLASLKSVKEFVEEFKSRGRALDLLINNAGVMACPYSQTADGLEMQFGTNHVGHFALTTGLLDELKKAPAARVVVVSSMGSFMVNEISYEAIEQRDKYSRTDNYAISKLANITFAATLARKLQGTSVKVNALHPGSVVTQLYRHIGTNRILHTIESAILMDEVAGSVTSTYVALSPEVENDSGEFFSRMLKMKMPPNATNIEEQDKLWEYTETLISQKMK
ncbi:hypothetical protein GGI07_002248 [Coemansia sp. Benny D115]|nr:hypothetical protein GGI07_002248 [Coemansia sp. Benny D115]